MDELKLIPVCAADEDAVAEYAASLIRNSARMSAFRCARMNAGRAMQRHSSGWVCAKRKSSD